MLPSLHQLSIGGIASGEPPKTRGRRKARLATNLKAVAEAKPEPKRPPPAPPRRVRSAPARPPGGSETKTVRDSKQCLFHQKGTPFEYQITQKDADRWFNHNDSSDIGSGSYGAARSYRVPPNELRGSPWVAVKRFRSLRDAKKEVEMHLHIWQRSGLNGNKDCRQYLTMPACMQWPDPSVEFVYTVQTLVRGDDVDQPMKTQTLTDTVAKHAQTLRQVLPEVKKMIARQYGDMMGCFVKARMLHDDLHGGNVMVTHNLETLHVNDRKDTESRVYFKFTVIDWGLARTLDDEAFEANGVPKEICLYNDFFARYRPGDPEYEDQLQRDWRLMFGVKDASICRGEKWVGIYLMFYGLFFPTNWTDLQPRDGVTRAHIVDWVREAYLARIGVEYPLDERKRMRDVINDEARSFKDRKYKVLSADNVCRVF